MNRRQQFLTEEYYKSMNVALEASREYWADKVLAEDYPGQGNALRSLYVKNELFFSVLLKYTAGESFESIKEALALYVSALEEYQKNLAISEVEEFISPLNIEDELSEYEEFVQVVSLCILLFRKDLLARVLALTDCAGYKSDDLVYESMVAKVVERDECDDGWYHEHYSLLVEAMDCVGNGEQDAASECLKKYCENWYQGFANSNVAWFDTHLSMTEEDGGYFGYWAFEAAAFSFLFKINDKDITHMVYPRDLVEYARGYREVVGGGGVGKVYAGQTCTRSGYWFSPAQSDSRRFFKAGEIMPEFKSSSWGATIWYWSGEA